MTQPSNQKPTLLGSTILAAAGLYGAIEFWPHRHSDQTMQLAAWGAVALFALGSARTLGFLLPGLAQAFQTMRALWGKDESRGSAGWLTEQEARKAKLHRRRKGSRFAGVLGGTPLWLKTETHSLILGPSGSSKSTAAIINILCGSSESALVNDTKGELLEVVGAYRKKAFGHEIVEINPKKPETSAQINVVDFIATFVEQDSAEALTLVRGMVLQLYPEPSTQDQNRFFRDGARILLVTVILAVIVVMPKDKQTMAVVYRAMNDLVVLESLLAKASKSDALGGEIADMATSTHNSAFGDDGSAKTFEQFRLGALQAIEAFGPGNYLAAITSKTTFSFADLKRKKMTVFLVIDYTNKDVLGKFSGLMQWLAAYQLVGVGNFKPVMLVLDEFCNSPLYILPTILTLLRTYGVQCILATQDLDDIERTYSKHALETVLSETDIKQILGGVRSQKTLEYFSKYMGEFSETTASFSLGRDGVQESLSRTNRRLLTEDEFRRLDAGGEIIFFGNNKPILARKVQVFAIQPWRKRIAPNSLYGGKRKLLPVEVKVGWFGTTVTRHGRRMYEKVRKATAGRSRGRVWRALGQLLPKLSPSPKLILLAALAFGIWTAGLPHLRWEYAYEGPRTSAHGAPIRYIWCRYIGTDPVITRGPNCPLIIFRKSW